MKKLLFLILTCIALTACSSTDAIERESHSFNYAGVIEPIEMSIWQYGTHTLTTNGGDLYAVKSDTIDLNEYNNKSVQVEGEVIEGYPVDSGPEFLDIKSIQVMNK